MANDLTIASSSIAQISDAQVLNISAARDLVLILYFYKKDWNTNDHTTPCWEVDTSMQTTTKFQSSAVSEQIVHDFH